jgi:hypothetical protein
MRSFTSHAIGAATAGTIALGALATGPAAAADIPYSAYPQPPAANEYYGNPPPVDYGYRRNPPAAQYGYPPSAQQYDYPPQAQPPQAQYEYPPQTYYDDRVAVAPGYGSPPVVVAPPYYGRPVYGPIYGAPFYGPGPYPYMRYGHNWRRFGHRW